MRKCDHANCQKEGKYRAPKDKSLSSYYYFCLDHIKEYNKDWNYYKGLEGEAFEKAILEEQNENRTIWNQGQRFKAEDLKNAEDALEIFKKRQTRLQSPFKRHSSEEQAMKTMGLVWPITHEKLKIRYKEIVKKVHPDMTAGQTEEEFKKANEAFSILERYFKK